MKLTLLAAVGFVWNAWRCLLLLVLVKQHIHCNNWHHQFNPCCCC
jgi:hypothetical protein